MRDTCYPQKCIMKELYFDLSDECFSVQTCMSSKENWKLESGHDYKVGVTRAVL